MTASLSFLLALAKLLLGAIIVWGLIHFLPISDWMKRVAEILLLLIVIFSILSDAVPLAQGDQPFPINPNSPSNPSRVR